MNLLTYQLDALLSYEEFEEIKDRFIIILLILPYSHIIEPLELKMEEPTTQEQED